MAGRPYVWTVNVAAVTNGVAVLDRLLGVVKSCLVADATHRVLLRDLLTTLGDLQRDIRVSVDAVGDSSTTGGRPPTRGEGDVDSSDVDTSRSVDNVVATVLLDKSSCAASGAEHATRIVVKSKELVSFPLIRKTSRRHYRFL